MVWDVFTLVPSVPCVMILKANNVNFQNSNNMFSRSRRESYLMSHFVLELLYKKINCHTLTLI